MTEVIIYTILALIIIFGSLSIYYIILYNKIQNNLIRINEAESVIDDVLRERFDLIDQADNIIAKEIKINPEIFNEVKELKNKRVSNFEFDRKTTEAINLILQIQKDYTSLNDNKSIKNVVQNIKNSEEKIQASKTFYNKYTSNLNLLIRKFPSNIIARIHNIKEKLYFDNKDMNDDIINDFKI